MKKQKIFFVLIILFACFQNYFGQENKDNLFLFDSMVEPECEYLLHHLNYLVIETLKNSDSVGYVVIHGGANPVQNKFYELYIKDYLSKSDQKNRFVVITTKQPVDKIKIDLLMSRNADTKPVVTAEDFKYKLAKTDKPVFFGQEFGELAKIDENWTFLGGCAACCFRTTSPYLLSEFLKSNPQLNADIKIYVATKKQFKQLEKNFTDEAVSEYEIPRTRLKISYGGQFSVNYQLPENNASIEIKLVPIK